jgi:hypothetical protein
VADRSVANEKAPPHVAAWGGAVAPTPRFPDDWRKTTEEGGGAYGTSLVLARRASPTDRKKGGEQEA